MLNHSRLSLSAAFAFLVLTNVAISDEKTSPSKPSSTREYDNRLRAIENPRPILADYPDFVQPVVDVARWEAAPLIEDPDGNLSVRTWRWSYNARGIIEMPNRLRGEETAVVVVHPWGIDDGQGWRTPEPAGCAFQCTLEKNAVLRRHVQTVVNPLLKRLRSEVKFTIYSLPGKEDPVRKKIYRSLRSQTTAKDRELGQKELTKVLNDFSYEGQPLPAKLTISSDLPVIDYFKQFPGLDASARYNHEGFWQLPTPVIKDIDVALDDIVVYDAEGYEIIRDFLKQHGIRHVILAGYNTDMCVCSTTAGYQNMRRDFNVMLVGDATVATFPANSKPAYSTNAAVSYAALNLLITQTSWIETSK